jgi:hypothetical protein
VIVLLQGAIEKQNPCRKGMGEVSGSWIENAGLIARGGLALVINRGKAAKGDTEGEAQVICWGLGFEFFDVFRGGSFWAIDGLLGPLLSPAPRRSAWLEKFDRRLSMLFMQRKCSR